MKMLCGLALCVSFLSLRPVRADDWPRFRGPNGSGVSQSAKLPVEFNAERNLSWKVTIPPGHSSPVICGSQLYVTSFDTDVLRTHALDTQTGKTLWTGELSRTRQAKHHALNNAASPSAACDNTGVVVFFADFGLAAWKHDGKPGWRSPMPALASNHGMASSLVLAGDLVVQVLGSD